jgi:polysaccharide chain length determinant protein (PEP-CTERM system associated)
MNPEIRYYISVFLKRVPLFLFIAVLFSFAGIATAILLPTVYKAKALLLVESAQIPGDLAESTVQVTPAEQLEIFEKRLMTRSNLLEIARDFTVFETLDSMTADAVVASMRTSTSIRSSTGRNRATIMTVEFNARTGQIAAAVANEFVTRILSESAKLRTAQAGGTLEFFEQQVAALEVELQVQSARIIDFQNANSTSLPDSLNYRLNRQNSLLERRQQLSREILNLDDQASRLIEVASANQQFEEEQGPQKSAEELQLTQLEDELRAALAIYSESNPRIRLLKARIEKLRDSVAENAADATEAAAVAAAAPIQPGPSRSQTVLDVQLAEIASLKGFNQEQLVVIDSELEALEESISKTPNNGIALEALKRDYSNVERQYNKAVNDLSAAATGERIEVMSKGQKINVIEQAVPPNAPHSPNRPVIAGTGVFAGLGVGAGLVLLLELMNKSIRRPMDLTNAFGISPIATVPFISSDADRLQRRMWAFAILIGMSVLLPAILYYIHLNVYSMDRVLDLFIERLREMGIMDSPGNGS